MSTINKNKFKENLYNHFVAQIVLNDFPFSSLSFPDPDDSRFLKYCHHFGTTAKQTESTFKEKIDSYLEMQLTLYPDSEFYVFVVGFTKDGPYEYPVNSNHEHHVCIFYTMERK